MSGFTCRPLLVGFVVGSMTIEKVCLGLPPVCSVGVVPQALDAYSSITKAMLC